MRILVTGKNGQLGKSIHKVVNSEVETNNNLSSHNFVFVGREELDLNSESNINHYFDNSDKFDVIINCAAYTAVDKAEEEKKIASQVNHLAVEQIAQIAKKQQAKLIHISTDYVFDGESVKSYVETDETNPINVYGRTKLAGEQALKEVMPTNAIIIRVSWVYSEYGNNFVKTMLRLGQTREELNVVGDQIGSPTYATDLADAILSIINSKDCTIKGNLTEIYHYSNNGDISWCEFAREIFKLEKVDCKVYSVTTRQYPTLAKRAKNTTLNTSKIKLHFGIESCNWKISLNNFFKFKRENANI